MQAQADGREMSPVAGESVCALQLLYCVCACVGVGLSRVVSVNRGVDGQTGMGDEITSEFSGRFGTRSGGDDQKCMHMRCALLSNEQHIALSVRPFACASVCALSDCLTHPTTATRTVSSCTSQICVEQKGSRTRSLA
jgi:hypothetical protein